MPLDGLQLDRYLLLHIIGSGGMGDVYLAEDTRIAQRVAIKVIRAEKGLYNNTRENEAMARRFRKEAQAIARLDHPNILQLFAYGEEQINNLALIYLVMPYRAEGSLADWTRQHAKSALLPTSVVAHFIAQAAAALQHAHDCQVIHQDVKPSNFLVRTRKEAPTHPDLLLSDFGIARLITATSSTSQSISGTPAYMAPEQWEGEPVPASDQYALAVMTYELLTGQLPFRGRMEQIMRLHLSTQPEPPSAYRPDLSAAIDLVLLRALAKKPEERFASVIDFANAFQQALQYQDLDNTLVVSREELIEDAAQAAQTRDSLLNVPTLSSTLEAKEMLFSPTVAAKVGNGNSKEGNIATPIPSPLLQQTTKLPFLPYKTLNSRLLLIMLVIFVLLISSGLMIYNTVNGRIIANNLHTGITSHADATPQQRQVSPTTGGAVLVFTNETATATSAGYATATATTNKHNQQGTATTIANNNATATAITNGDATATSVAIGDANATATVVASAGATATASAQPEILYVPFANGTSGVQTVRSYQGTVTITISGTGQASSSQYSDAFYIYTDSAGNPITPVHPIEYYNWTLWIDGGPADNFVSPIPAYNPSHVYTFTIKAPGGTLNFAVGDTYISDNTGGYKVEIS